MVGSSLSIVTIHGKERVVFPAFEEHLSAKCTLCHEFDTDSLGTFTGEIPRTLSPLDAALTKCRKALELTGTRLAVATEGSFGPHPEVFIITAGHELIVVLDREDGTVYQESETTTDTNFSSLVVKDVEDLRAFAQKAKFPEHGLILKPLEASALPILKGIQDWDYLQRGFSLFRSETGGATVETDMRAMHNPTRMRHISVLASRLAKRLSTQCPGCQRSGFGQRSYVAGLPCSCCGFPTRSAKAIATCCQFCRFTSTEPIDRVTEDPRHCDLCNP